MSQRNIVYVAGTSNAVGPIVGSGFTHAILSTCHLNQNPALSLFRILTGPTGIITLFRASEFSQWLSALDAGEFPASLRAASEMDFIDFGETLSDDVSVTVNTAGSSWTLTDNAAGNTFPVQVDPNGTFVSFNGGPLVTVTDPTTISSYTKHLDDGKFPAGMLASSGLPGHTGEYEVTQAPAQTNGLAQWQITYKKNSFIYFAHMVSSTEMKLSDIQYVYSANLQAFEASLDALSNGGIPMLASFGGYGVDGDWQIMGQDPQQSLIVIADFFDAFGIAGIDYDWEMPDESSSQQDADVAAMTQFTASIQQGRPGTICTICPYDSTVSQLLEVWTNVGFDAIAWANCQMYSPNNNPPLGFSDTFAVPIAAAFPNEIDSAADAGPYTCVGFTSSGLDATQFAALIAAVVAGDPTGTPPVPAFPNLGGAFTYNLAGISGSLQTWASDVATALAGGSG